MHIEFAVTAILEISQDALHIVAAQVKPFTLIMLMCGFFY